MENSKHPIGIVAADAPPKTKSSNYPEPFYSRMNKREKRPLGDLFNLTNYGVNLTRLAPEGVSALRHAHSRQDEFVYILQGEPTLVTNAGETMLRPGMCAGFKAGTGDGHHLINRSDAVAIYLEAGSRQPDDLTTCSDVDMMSANADGRFRRKDGTPYPQP